MNAAEPAPTEAFLEEAHCFNQAVAMPLARARMRRFLEVGGQTRDTELELGSMLLALSEHTSGRPPLAAGQGQKL